MEGMRIWCREIWSAAMLLIGSIMDIRYKHLSKRYLFICGLGCIALLLWQSEAADMKRLYGILPGTVLLLVGRVSGGSIGTADGIMLLFLGVLYGGLPCLEILFLALLFAVGVAIVLIVLRRAGRRTRMPFYPFLLLALFFYLWQTHGG